MLRQLTITLLQRTLAEVTPEGYKLSKDRILGALDVGRNAIYPANGRTPQQMQDIMLAYQEATRQIAKTYLNRDMPEEEEAYIFLAMHGANIPIEGLKLLLERTLARLEQEMASKPEALEAVN